MKILFTICGRAGSKGLKNKNLKSFIGKPLPFYSVSIIDLFIKSNKQYECDLVLNTDSEDLINLFTQNLSVKFDVIRRRNDLAKDTTPKVPVIYNCLYEMEHKTKKKYDMVVDLDITSPLRKLSDLESVIEKKKQMNVDVVFTVTEARRNPYFNMVKKSENGYERVIESKFNSRQEAPEIYDMNASIYAYSPEFLSPDHTIFDGRCEATHMEDTAVLDIDSEKDFEMMEVVAYHLFSVNDQMKDIRENIQNIMK